jgi:uncharacterized protein
VHQEHFCVRRGTDKSDWRLCMKIDEWLLEILACPKCHAPLRADEEANELVCTGADCGLAYPVRDDIPVLLIDEARDPSARGRE